METVFKQSDVNIRIANRLFLLMRGLWGLPTCPHSFLSPSPCPSPSLSLFLLPHTREMLATLCYEAELREVSGEPDAATPVLRRRYASSGCCDDRRPAVRRCCDAGAVLRGGAATTDCCDGRL